MVATVVEGAAGSADDFWHGRIPFLFVSGYGSDSLPESFRGRSVLQKPFVVSKLSAAIEAILDP
jgi:hypothetical protein